MRGSNPRPLLSSRLAAATWPSLPLSRRGFELRLAQRPTPDRDHTKQIDYLASIDAVLRSQLLGAVVSAVLRHPTSALVQLHAARALLAMVHGGDACAAATLKAEGAALLASMLQQRDRLLI